MNQGMIRPNPHVLVVAHADGYLTVHGTEGIRARVANMLSVPISGEYLAEEYLALTLPHVYRSLYLDARRCIATGQVRSIRPSDVARQQLDLAVARTIGDLMNPVAVTTWIA